MATSFISLNIDNTTYIQVGQALKEKSLKKIKETIKANLEILLNQSLLKDILFQIKSIPAVRGSARPLFELNTEIKKYHASQRKIGQFAGIETGKNFHYQIDKTGDLLVLKLTRVDYLLNILRSAVLGLPILDYSISVVDGQKKYFITSEMFDTKHLILEASKGVASFTGAHLKLEGANTARVIRNVIDLIKEDEYVKQIQYHYTNMFPKIREHSDPKSTPEPRWAAQVFQKHIRVYKEYKNMVSDSYNWDHDWDVNSFWDDYHSTHPDKFRKRIGKNKFLGYSSQTQGGDDFQTQVKNFIFSKTGESGNYISFENLNVLEDTFTFWDNLLLQINESKTISEKNINELLSVLLSNDTIKQLGYKTLGKIRQFKW